MTLGCGSWCVYFRDKGSVCHTCPNWLGYPTPRNTLGIVDPFKLAEGLARKKEQQRREAIPTLDVCPQCDKSSLFYDRIHDHFECLNLECPYTLAGESVIH